MIGGDSDDVEAANPCFEAMGKTIKHQGPAGAGQHTKMVNQILIGPTMIAVCEAMLYAYQSGLDPLKVIESVGSGGAASWAINNLGPRIVRRDFEPGFYVEHFIKDMGIAHGRSQEDGSGTSRPRARRAALSGGASHKVTLERERKPLCSPWNSFQASNGREFGLKFPSSPSIHISSNDRAGIGMMTQFVDTRGEDFRLYRESVGLESAFKRFLQFDPGPKQISEPIFGQPTI